MADDGSEVGPSIPMAVGTFADHSSMEGRLANVSFPLNVKLFMKFRPTDKEQVFDFRFTDYSKEP